MKEKRALQSCKQPASQTEMYIKLWYSTIQDMHTNLKFRRYRTRVHVVHGRVELGDMLVSNASHTLTVITVR